MPQDKEMRILKIGDRGQLQFWDASVNEWMTALAKEQLPIVNALEQSEQEKPKDEIKDFLVNGYPLRIGDKWEITLPTAPENTGVISELNADKWLWLTWKNKLKTGLDFLNAGWIANDQIEIVLEKPCKPFSEHLINGYYARVGDWWSAELHGQPCRALLTRIEYCSYGNQKALFYFNFANENGFVIDNNWDDAHRLMTGKKYKVIKPDNAIPVMEEN